MDVDVAVEGSNVIGCSATGPFGLWGVSENYEIVRVILDGPVNRSCYV